MSLAAVCVLSECGSSCSLLGARRFAVVLNPSYGGFAEETVLVVHQMLIDAGFARLVGTRLKDC